MGYEPILALRKCLMQLPYLIHVTGMNYYSFQRLMIVTEIACFKQGVLLTSFKHVFFLQVF